MKKYIVYAGVNGAGKSTIYSTVYKDIDMPRINIDEIVKEFGDWRNGSDVMKAGKIAIKKREEYFSKGISFNQETTLCGQSIIRTIKRAKEEGYIVEMHYIGINSVELAKERISARVRLGEKMIALELKDYSILLRVRRAKWYQNTNDKFFH